MITRLIQLVIALFLTFSIVPGAVAHPGDIDASCGHVDASTKKYHYHRDRKSCKSSTSRKQAFTAEGRGTVLKVHDGDTLVLKPSNGGGAFFTCRLYGIDAPETNKPKGYRRKAQAGQPYGDEAANALKRLALGNRVSYKLTGDQTYGREVCLLESAGVNVNLEMVRLGLAWAYLYHLRAPYAPEFIRAEEQARARKLGLWRDTNPLPPWDHRKMIR